MKIFLENSIKNELKGNIPLILDRPDRVYITGSDTIDLFIVKMKKGKFQSRKKHILRCFKGEMITGFEKGEDDLVVVASGKSGSFLYELSIENLKKELPENRELLSLLENWIGSLSKIMINILPPKNPFNLVDGKNTLPPESCSSIKTGDKLKWIDCKNGEAFFLSMDVFNLKDFNSPFPLHEKAWIYTRSQAEINLISSMEYFSQDRDFQGLKKFNRLFLSMVSGSIKEEGKNEFFRRMEVIKNDEKMISNALSKLGKTMEYSTRISHGESNFTDPLSEACRIVGMECGINVLEPTKESLINSDPLNAISAVSGFRTRKVALTHRWWKSDSGAMLGFIADGETEKPAALIRKNSSYHAFDPESGEGFKINRKTNEKLGIFAYSFYRPLPPKPLKASEIYRFGMLGSKKDQLMIILMAASGASLGLLTPVATGIIFDRFIPEADRFGLFFIGAILISCAISQGLFEITKGIATLRITGRTDHSIQAGVMDRLLSLPVSFFRNYNAGDLTERALGINAIRNILSSVTISAVMGGFFSLFNLILLFYYSPELAIVAVVITFLSLWVLAGAGFSQLKFQRIIQTAQGKLSGTILQFISGISKLRVSGTEDRAFANWAETFSKMRKASFKSRSINAKLTSFNSALPVISMLIIFFWIINSSLDEKISVGSIIAFNSAFNLFQTAMLQMFAALMDSMEIIPLYERSKPIFTSIPEKDEAKASPGELRGEIEVNSLNFRYDPEGEPVLRDISMKINPGEFAAIVGSSGSGKSTLLRLLLGFENPESGTIYYDGQDISGLDITAVRRQFGVVLQNGTLMSGDLFSNIVGSLNLTIDDAWEAAEMAGLKKDIREMPMGMHTIIPPGGGTLSGGQKQRLLIARAIVHRPRIIYFDEATSALDNKTQKQVSESLENLNATRVIIAHRLSTIKNADKIFVIDKGKIVQQGNFHELNSSPGIFSELVKRQTA